MDGMMTQSMQVVDVNGSTIVPPTMINAYSALSIPAFRRAVQFLSENLASFPRSVRKDGAKLDTPHPVAKLIGRRPNAYQNSFIFWRCFWFHAAATGNAYARIERDPLTSRPIALHNLLPEDTLAARWDPGDGTGPVQVFYHRPTKTLLFGTDVLYMQGLSHDGMCGLSPTSLHEGTFQRAATLLKFQTRYWQKGTQVRGVLELKDKPTPEQLAEYRAALQRFRGVDGDEILIIGNGELKNTTISPEQSQLAEQGSITVADISRITGVPQVYLMDGKDARYNNSVEAAGIDVVRFTFRPLIELAEDELTLKLLTEDEQDDGLTIRINPDALLRGSSREQMDVVATGVKAGIYTSNEGRDYLGMPRHDDPDADKLKMSGDTAPKPPAQ